MGVLNVTPDSFYDKGRFYDAERALSHALEMERDGADIIDIGGESTRPGAEDVSTQEELKRVIPVIEAISKRSRITISIDTRKSVVAEAALRAGAKIVNDVSALTGDPAMAEVVAKHEASVVLMHMKGTPKDMQIEPKYDDVVNDIIGSLKKSVTIARRSGIPKENIIVDPGIGFGKTVAHNLEILRRLEEFKEMGFPVCIGTSRKSFIGKLLGSDDPMERLSGTIATSAIAVMKGASILRVHDIKENLAAAKIADSIYRYNGI